MKYINKSEYECYDISEDINFPPGEVIESEPTPFITKKINEGILGQLEEEGIEGEEDLSKFTVAELKEIASERNVELDSDDKKQEIIEKIKVGA